MCVCEVWCGVLWCVCECVVWCVSVLWCGEWCGV